MQLPTLDGVDLGVGEDLYVAVAVEFLRLLLQNSLYIIAYLTTDNIAIAVNPVTFH